MTERRAFFVIAGLILLIPAVVGPVSGFFGLEGLAALFGLERTIHAPPGLRNHLRAIGFMFFVLVPLVVWSLGDLRSRAGAFRIVLGCAFVAGFARLTGYVVDGAPGVVPTIFMILELVGMPVLLLWHRRLLAAA